MQLVRSRKKGHRIESFEHMVSKVRPTSWLIHIKYLSVLPSMELELENRRAAANPAHGK